MFYVMLFYHNEKNTKKKMSSGTTVSTSLLILFFLLQPPAFHWLPLLGAGLRLGANSSLSLSKVGEGGQEGLAQRTPGELGEAGKALMV